MTRFDTRRQSKLLKPLTARPWRSGNSSPRSVWHSAVVSAEETPRQTNVFWDFDGASIGALRIVD